MHIPLAKQYHILALEGENKEKDLSRMSNLVQCNQGKLPHRLGTQLKLASQDFFPLK